jgi:hypothetical protein
MHGKQAVKCLEKKSSPQKSQNDAEKIQYSSAGLCDFCGLPNYIFSIFQIYLLIPFVTFAAQII